MRGSRFTSPPGPVQPEVDVVHYLNQGEFPVPANRKPHQKVAINWCPVELSRRGKPLTIVHCTGPPSRTYCAVTLRQNDELKRGSINRSSSCHWGKYLRKLVPDIRASFAGYKRPPAAATMSSRRGSMSITFWL